MKVLVFTPVWQRPRITKAYCLGIQRLARDFDIETLCVLSPEDTSGNKQLLDSFGLGYTYFKNKLGAKKNYGLQEAMKMDWDYMMELNSDDVVYSELMATYEELMKRGVSFIGLGNFAFYNAATGESKHKDKCATLFGIGRCYSREMLEDAANVVNVEVTESRATHNDYYKKGHKRAIHPELVDEDIMEVKSSPYFKLWDDEADNGMDNHSRAVLERGGYSPYVVGTESPQAFDIKSDVNIWPWHKMSGTPYDTEKLFEGISDKEKDYLNAIRKNN